MSGTSTLPAATPPRFVQVRHLRRNPLRTAFGAIAVVTVLSGIGQLLEPGAVLRLLSATPDPTSRHLFATIGMFMAVIGGLTLHALLEGTGPPPYVIMWATAQKLGASVAVAIGVADGLFGAVALPVALFDFATAALGALLWLQLRRGDAGKLGGPA
jgi:hypothetical protein